FICFIIIRRSTSSTLFPYTTLFRSVPLGERRVAPVQYLGEGLGPGDPLCLLAPEGDPVPVGLLVDVGLDVRVLRQLLWRVEVALDRKSTRLNSSHVAISYAVFCLKK